MLPQVYSEGLDVKGWLMSEKLDGMRGYWDGKQLLSKNGLPLHPPTAFVHNFPPFALEGEIWGGRGTFEKTISIARKQQVDDRWLKLKFAIFDVPEKSGGFSKRLQKARDWFREHPSQYGFIIEQIPVTGNDHLKQELKRIEELDGEGLIVRKPDSLYRSGRSSEILKVKSYLDTEAEVIGHVPGQGKHTGRIGSLLVVLPNGIQFKVGTGFTDKERESPPEIGAVITFKYYGLYASGKPKFPVFLRIRSKKSI